VDLFDDTFMSYNAGCIREACQIFTEKMIITDARPDTGGLSGATPNEAISCGKVDPGGLPNTVVAYLDSTVALPLITAYALQRGRKRKHKRLYNRRQQLIDSLHMQYHTARTKRR